MFHCLLDDIHQILSVDSIRLGHESSAGCDSHGRSIERSHGVSVRSGLRYETLGGSRGSLALGQAVYLVIENEVSDIHISLHRMHGMTQADSIGVTIAGADDHMGIFIGTFDTLGKRQSSAVGGMSAVAVLIAADTGRTADTGNQGDGFIGPAHFCADSGNSILDTIVAAAGAPVRNNRIFIISR